MKKLYFEDFQNFTDFRILCRLNKISYKKIETKGKLYVLEIEDSLENDEFLYNNGY